MRIRLGDRSIYFDRGNVAFDESTKISAGPLQKIVRLRSYGGFRVLFQNMRERRRNLDLLGAVNVWHFWHRRQENRRIDYCTAFRWSIPRFSKIVTVEFSCLKEELNWELRHIYYIPKRLKFFFFSIFFYFTYSTSDWIFCNLCTETVVELRRTMLIQFWVKCNEVFIPLYLLDAKKVSFEENVSEYLKTKCLFICGEVVAGV